MPSTLELNDFLRPERAEKRDLLLDPPTAIREAHTECFVFDLVPADANTEDESTARQDVDLGRLFRDEGRLPLGQHEHRRRESQAGRDRREIAEQHQRLVEHRSMVIRAGPAPRPVGVGAEDVVEDHQVVVAELLDGPGISRDHVGIRPDLELREHRAHPHEGQYRCVRPLREGAPANPSVRADDAIEQHDERALRRSQAASEVDPHDARRTEADREAAIPANDGAPEKTRRGETRRTRPDEVLSLIGASVHEIATVRPDAVEP